MLKWLVKPQGLCMCVSLELSNVFKTVQESNMLSDRKHALLLGTAGLAKLILAGRQASLGAHQNPGLGASHTPQQWAVAG